MSQDLVQLKPGRFTALVEQFIQESQKIYDTLKIHNKRYGVVTIEPYNSGKGFFRLGNFPYNKQDSYDSADLTLEFRVSMVFNKDFFYGIRPSAYTTIEERPIIFHYGLERDIFFDLNDYKVFNKVVAKYLLSDNTSIVTWLVRIDDLKEVTVIIKKESYW